MTIEVRCITCNKSWEQQISQTLNFAKVVAYQFCGVCYKSMMREFERQFVQKLLPERIHFDEGD